jgi:hypothetical protein
MKQWLIGLVAIILLSGCSSVASDPALTSTVVMVPTSVPTAIPTPLPTTPPTPEPSPTPDVLESVNQYVSQLLREQPGFDASLLDTSLPLARFLWGTDGEQFNRLRRRHLVKPEYTQLETLPPYDLYPEPTMAIRVMVEASGNALYPSGTIILWTGGQNRFRPIDANTPEFDRLGTMVLSPSQPGNQIQLDELTINGRRFHTFVEYNTNNKAVAFVNPDSHLWATPLTFDPEKEGFNYYVETDTTSDGVLGSKRIYWVTESGESLLLTTGPYGRPLQDELETRRLQMKEEIDSSTEMLALVLVDDAGRVFYQYDSESKTWVNILSETQILFIPAQSFVNDYGIELDHELTEIDPVTGHVTWFSRDVNGNPIATVRTAHDADGIPVRNDVGELILVFATESYVLANHEIITGGRFEVGGKKVTFGYMNGTPEVSSGEIVVRDIDLFLDGLSGLFPVPARTCVVNTSHPPTANYTCLTDTQAAAISDILVVAADSTQPLPGIRTMFQAWYLAGNTYHRISYYWNPYHPEMLVVYVNLDPILIRPVSDPRTNHRRIHFGVISIQLRSLAYLHLKPNLRPSNAKPVVDSVNERTDYTDIAWTFLMSSYFGENVTMEKR